MNRKLLKKGDRIRLKVRTIGGWKGTATVTADEQLGSDLVQFRKDGDDESNWANNLNFCGREECTKVREL